MKFQVTMKTPDALGDAIHEASQALTIEGLDDEELEIERDEQAIKARDLCDRWFRSGEYLTVEIDTDAETCVVVAAR
jgi:hypothetical protein